MSSFQMHCKSKSGIVLGRILMRMQYFTKQSHLGSTMFEQPIELWLVHIEFMSRMLLHA